MWPYFLLVFVILILQFELSEKNTTNIRFYIGIVILFVFAAFRGNGDGDYFAYLSYGSDIQTLQDVLYTHKNMEIGYRIIAFGVNYMNLPNQAIIMAMNLISIACICIFVKRYSVDRCFSLLLFFPLYFQFDMHAARTAVAISISSLAFRYALERKPIKFIITILFASMFHASAIIVLPLYILVYIKLNLLGGLVSIGFGMLFVKIIGFDTVATTLLRLLNMESYLTRYLIYASDETYGYEYSLLDPRLIILIVTYVISVIVIKNKGRYENLLINCCLADVLLLIFFSEHTALANRLSSYYNVYTIILVPVIMKNMYEWFEQYRHRYVGMQNKLISRFSCIAFYCLLAAAYAYSKFVAYGTDYRFFWSNV